MKMIKRLFLSLTRLITIFSISTYLIAIITTKTLINPAYYIKVITETIFKLYQNPITIIATIIFILLIVLHELIHYIYLKAFIPESQPDIVFTGSIIAPLVTDLDILKLKASSQTHFFAAVMLPSILIMPLALLLNTLVPISGFEVLGGFWIAFVLLGGIIPIVFVKPKIKPQSDNGNIFYKHSEIMCPDYVYAWLNVIDGIFNIKTVDYIEKRYYGEIFKPLKEKLSWHSHSS